MAVRIKEIQEGVIMRMETKYLLMAETEQTIQEIASAGGMSLQKSMAVPLRWTEKMHRFSRLWRE